MPARRPVVAVALCVSGGIITDWVFPLPLAVWLGLAVFALFAAGILFRTSFVFAIQACLLAASALLGGVWHHYHYLHAQDDIGNFTGEEPQLCRVRGAVTAEPICKRPQNPNDWNSTPRCNVRLSVTALQDGEQWIAATGNLIVHVEGELPGCRVGDTVEAIGWLARPEQPLNPAEFDYPQFLLAQRILAVLYCNGGSAVTILPHFNMLSVSEVLSKLRSRGSAILLRNLSTEQSDLALAVLLGDRQGMTPEELIPFLESGTIHLLVISGFHLMLIAGAIWWACGWLGLPLRGRIGLLLPLIWVYAVLTGADPPVVRAAIVLTVYFAGFVLNRPAHSLNSIAAAVLVILAADPTNLFRGGPQLSFLAVLAIVLFCRPTKPVDSPVREFDSAFIRVLRWAGTWLIEGLRFSTIIWLVVAPLVLHRFHLLSPISVPLSVLLVVPMFFSLLSGLLLLMASSIPGVEGIAGAICDGSLWLLRKLTGLAENVPWGSIYLPGFPWWWTAGFYTVLLAPWLFLRAFRPNGRYASMVAVWIAAGLIVNAFPADRQSLEYHQLAVGHGSCAVLRLPNGQTLLYDCGSLKGPEAAEKTVAPWLWHHGIGGIDAIVLSHADIDHFNGLQALARRFPIGVIYVSPQFVTSDEPHVRELIQFLLQRRLPIRFVWSGDSLGDGFCRFRILQPAAADQHPSDNSASIVGLVEYQGIRLVLTGDLEKLGLEQFLSTPGSADIFIVPHHGSKMSNSESTARWASAKLVISSQGNKLAGEDPLHVYRDAGATVWVTAHDGAICCRWTKAGVEASTFRTGQRLLIEREPASFPPRQSSRISYLSDF